MLNCAVDGWTIWKKVSEESEIETHQINTPDANFPAHADKVQIIKFHPLASDVVVTVGFDKTIKIWNLNETEEPKLELEVRGNSWSSLFEFIFRAVKVFIYIFYNNQ